MVGVISQDTFNEAVAENMSALDLTVEEAIAETVDQFRAQGVDLSNIVKEKWCVLGGQDPVAVAVNDLAANLDSFTELCGKDISLRLRAAELGAYDKLMSLYSSFEGENDLLKCVGALCALMDGYPDLLEEKGLEAINLCLSGNKGSGLVCKVLEWARLCCVRHEGNRKALIERNISESLKVLLEGEEGREEGVVSGVCKLITTLTLDDDIRHTVSNAHLHACLLAASVLPSLIPLLTLEKDDTISQILNCLASLLVRDTLCQQFVDLDGLVLLLSLLERDPPLKVLTRGLNVLSCLAGHDRIKDSIVEAGLAPKIASNLLRSKDSLPFCRSVLSLIARLSLRSSTNSLKLFNAGLGEAIVDVMKLYPSDKKVQSLSCLAVRNIASRSNDLRPKFVSLGIEGPLRRIPQSFPDLSDNSKAALLALDLPVKLKEEWTGQFGDKMNPL